MDLRDLVAAVLYLFIYRVQCESTLGIAFHVYIYKYIHASHAKPNGLFVLG